MSESTAVSPNDTYRKPSSARTRIWEIILIAGAVGFVLGATANYLAHRYAKIHDLVLAREEDRFYIDLAVSDSPKCVVELMESGNLHLVHILVKGQRHATDFNVVGYYRGNGRGNVFLHALTVNGLNEEDGKGFLDQCATKSMTRQKARGRR